MGERRRRTTRSDIGDASIRFERSKASELEQEFRRFRDGVDRLLKNEMRFPFSWSDRSDDNEREV